jgi:hypothetical protein
MTAYKKIKAKRFFGLYYYSTTLVITSRSARKYPDNNLKLKRFRTVFNQMTPIMDHNVQTSPDTTKG